MTPPRHLVLTPGLVGADGIGLVSRLAVRALLSSGREDGGPSVAVLSMDGAPSSAPFTPATSGVRVRCAGGRRIGFVGIALRAAAGAGASDVLCLHVHLSPLARLAATPRARLIVFLHGIEAWRRLGPMGRWALRRADVIIANSEHTARRFRRANPAFSQRSIAVCHLGVDPEPGAATPSGPDPADPFALIVGRLAAEERYKGHDLLIDLWPRIQAEAPGARLVVAGDGDDRPRLEARARALGDRVRFAGRVPDETLARLYRRCLFFAMPSRDEGFGLVFLEAMRAGRACIGAVGAAAEVIEDGVTGLLVDPDEPESVQKAVVRLFREPETRERMGRAGAARLAAAFTEAHFRRRFLGILGLAAP